MHVILQHRYYITMTDMNALKANWQLFDKNGTGMITSEEVGMCYFDQMSLPFTKSIFNCVFISLVI